jgi:hypothetical protein
MYIPVFRPYLSAIEESGERTNEATREDDCCDEPNVGGVGAGHIWRRRFGK